jgi:4-aminobutyrate aminotransferase-like enzyme
VSDATTFAASVAAACSRLEEKGIPPAAFIAETILSCGGQVEPPEGYLRMAYEHARNAGAVCIADEVQTGFGRMGTHFWAFETQGVVPDIVTMGKPIGNGHPIAAVVTTRAVADAFNNGMEYFNTYGGNPVSCAAAKAVLDVIKVEELQQNALAVGDFFLERLKELQRRFPIIGDVRGRGLFLGIELVRDRDTLEAADVEASYLVNRMQSHGVLLSTDGPLHNVIKIKPPMVFTRTDVGLVVEAMASVLAEDFMMGIGR